MVGGGSYPEYNMPGYAVALDIDGITAAEAEKRLREADIPVIVRVQHDRVLISVRTVQEDEFIIICRTFGKCLQVGRWGGFFTWEDNMSKRHKVLFP